MATEHTDTPTSTLSLVTDPVEVAREARLRYVSDQMPGIRRERVSEDEAFHYLGPDGDPITDPKEIERIEALRIPPAWTDVWICPRANGHILATGRDAKRRKQYIYHPRWRETRDQTKFSRMIVFGEALPKIREQTDHDLSLPGMPREKVLALVVRLLETTLIRIGNDEYARHNDSYGLTTLRDKHAKISGSEVTFEFWGKSNKKHSVTLHDRRLAKLVQRSKDIPGYQLFQYVDDNGQHQTVDSGDVNDYLREITGEEFTAKDFRTWGGTVLAIRALMEIGPAASETAAKKNMTAAVKQVAEQLGNTVTVCRKYYIHPSVFDCYLDQSLYERVRIQEAEDDSRSPYDLSPEEAAVVEFIRQCALPALKHKPNK